MSGNYNNHAQSLLKLLQACHSIIGIGWPKPNVPQMAGAKIFIGTNLFTALEDCIRRADAEFNALSPLAAMQPLLTVWKITKEMITSLSVLSSDTVNSQIDPAFNLAYLVTGLIYHRVGAILNVKPEIEPRFSNVENWDNLLHVCAWDKHGQSAESLLDAAEIEMRKCIDGLRVG